MIVVFLILGVAAVVEWPNLGSYSRGERAVFWALWGITLAWVLARAFHLPTPNFVQVQNRLFGGLGKRWLTPTRDPFW